MEPGPVTKEQLRRLDSVWRPGEHVLVSGPTGSGKTALARHLTQVRADRGGHVIAFVAKPNEDKTITNDYKGWTRWKSIKKAPKSYENRVLLWPDSKGLTGRALMAHHREVFGEALAHIAKVGRYTLLIDEGLYTTNSKQLNLEAEVAMLHQMGRSADVTVLTNAQRPAHLPLVLYGSASHAFIGRTRELADVKRLQELGGKEGSRELANRIQALSRHDFLWIPIAPDWDAEEVNLRR